MKVLTLLFGLFATTMVFAQDDIMLITPMDGDTIDTKHPLLAWYYQSGMPQVSDREYYRLILVELDDHQSAEAGVSVNTPLLQVEELSVTQMFYPYDAPELEDGHRYGWQIQKIKNDVIADKSEAWEFILPIEEPEFNKYVTLKAKHDGVMYEAIDGVVFFKMDESYGDNGLSYYIYDENHDLILKDILHDEDSGDNEDAVNVKITGANFYELDLGAVCSAGDYKLVVINGKKQKYQLKFTVK